MKFTEEEKAFLNRLVLNKLEIDLIFITKDDLKVIKQYLLDNFVNPLSNQEKRNYDEQGFLDLANGLVTKIDEYFKNNQN